MHSSAGTDEKAIVSVMGHRTFAQRQELIQTYKTLFSKDLQKELKSESSGNFKNVLMGLCQSPTEFMADQLRKAMKVCFLLYNQTLLTCCASFSRVLVLMKIV